MNLARYVGCLLATSATVGCSVGTAYDYDDGAYVQREHLDDVIVAAAQLEDWVSSAIYPLTDPFEDPYFYDHPTFLIASERAPTDDPVAAAALAADNAALYFQPGNCARVDQREDELTYALTACRAPFAPSVIDGLLRVSLSTRDGALAFQITSDGLWIDGQHGELSAEGTYRAANGVKTVEYSSQRSLQGELRAYSGEFDEVLTWTAGSNCVTRDASGVFMAAARSYDADITDYSRCARECPTSGAVSLSGDAGTDVLTFAGTPMARLERTAGGVRQIELACD